MSTAILLPNNCYTSKPGFRFPTQGAMGEGCELAYEYYMRQYYTLLATPVQY